MSELKIYFARAMDGVSREHISARDAEYDALLKPVGGILLNPYGGAPPDLIQDAGGVVESNLKLMSGCDLLLADVSVPAYQYVGCMFEIADAVKHEIPVIVVAGEGDLRRRIYLHAYADFIAGRPEEAVEYIRRAHTREGVARQIEEMKTYYSHVAPEYMTKSVRPDPDTPRLVGAFAAERGELRRVITRHARGKVCELGSGAGDWTTSICEVADEVVGVEPSAEMLEQAARRLARCANVRLLPRDALAEEIGGGPFDCVVVYFLLSLLPPPAQQLLFDRVERLLKPGGLLMVADTRMLRDVPAIGFGRRQIQQRRVGGQTYRLYKEHFVGETLARLLRRRGYDILDAKSGPVWFSWAVARS